MVHRIAHIGIAVKDLDAARSLFETLLKIPVSHTEHVEKDHVDVCSIPVDGTNIELTAGTAPDSPISRFIEKRGEGIHHIAFEVDDIHAELARLTEAGITLIDQIPRLGADGYLVAFVHPKSAGGVLVELSQKESAHGS